MTAMLEEDSAQVSNTTEGPKNIDTQDWTTEDDIIEIQPILEAEAQHGPIFRRELFDIAYAAWQKFKVDESQDQGRGEDDRQQEKPSRTYTVKDIYGEDQEVEIFRAARRQDKWPGMQNPMIEPMWTYNCLQHLGYKHHNKNYSSRLIPYRFAGRVFDLDEEVCFDGIELKKNAVSWEQDWRNSKSHSHFTKFLKQQYSTNAMPRVDKFVCFGLGCFPSNSKRSACTKRSYIQHLAACTLRDIIALHQRGPSPQIYVQDPEYCAPHTSYLETHFAFQVLPDPEAFKLVDEHTFVMTVAPNVAVRQVVMGLTHGSGGPAGLLCDTIVDDGTTCNTGHSDAVGKGVRRTLMTCDTSPALWAYKQSSLWTEYDDSDGENFFGGMGMYLKGRRKESK